MGIFVVPKRDPAPVVPMAFETAIGAFITIVIMVVLATVLGGCSRSENRLELEFRLKHAGQQPVIPNSRFSEQRGKPRFGNVERRPEEK